MMSVRLCQPSFAMSNTMNADGVPSMSGADRSPSYRVAVFAPHSNP